MLKEKGYDEFLAEKIRIGKEQIKAGKYVSLDVAKERTRLKLEQKIREMNARQYQEAIYG